MTWNYRVYKKTIDGEDWLSIRETYYDENNSVNGYTAIAIAPQSDTIEGLREILKRMLRCIDRPVLEDE